jgi:anti-sigma regulatory factor (Ser/Thr protein kinase)
MSAELHESWPAEPSSVPRARAAVVALARSAQASADALADVRLAVSEAVTNVVVHAYTGVAASPGPLHVRARIAGRKLLVEVSDEGGGLRPRPDSPGIGVGLRIMSAVTEELRLSNADGEPSRVAMTFDLDVVHAVA